MEMQLGDLVDRLSIINLKIWHLESAIREGQEEGLGLEEVGRRALQIRDLNKERIALKNALNEPTGEIFKDAKVNHVSA